MQTKRLDRVIGDVFKNVEYIEISRDGAPIYTVTEDVNGKSKFEFQKKLGEMFGIGRFTASVKFKGSFTNKTFPIRSIVLGENMNKKEITETKINKNENIDLFMQKLTSLNPAESFKSMLEITKTTYQNEISRLKESISDMKMEIRELKIDNKDLQKENSKFQNKVYELESESGSGNNFIDMITQFNQLRSTFSKKSVNLKSNLEGVKTDVKGIPQEFLAALGKVDYSKIPQQDILKYIQLFDNIANQLPLKETKK